MDMKELKFVKSNIVGGSSIFANDLMKGNSSTLAKLKIKSSEPARTRPDEKEAGPMHVSTRKGTNESGCADCNVIEGVLTCEKL